MRVLVRGSRISLLRVQESGKGLLFPEDHRDKAEAIKAKVRAEAIKAKVRVGAIKAKARVRA